MANNFTCLSLYQQEMQQPWTQGFGGSGGGQGDEEDKAGPDVVFIASWVLKKSRNQNRSTGIFPFWVIQSQIIKWEILS